MGTSSHRIWSDDHEVYSLFTDTERILGQVVKCFRRFKGESRESGWDAFDMTKMNASKTGCHSIGHFKTREAAKDAVERYWESRNKGNGHDTRGQQGE